MAAETGFDIDGTLYEVPSLDSFDLDELQVLYDYCGLTIEDFVTPPDENDDDARARERQFKNPGLIRALMHVAYQRGNPKTRPATIKDLIGKANALNVLAALAEDMPVEEEDGQVPLESTSEPDESSQSDSHANTPSSEKKSVSSGAGSTNGSDPPDNAPKPIGRSRSVTSSLGSPRTTWVP